MKFEVVFCFLQYCFILLPVSNKIKVSSVFIFPKREVLERNFKHSSLLGSANIINGFWVC